MPNIVVIRKLLVEKAGVFYSQSDLDRAIQKAERTIGNMVHYRSGYSHEADDIATVAAALLDFRIGA